MKFLQNKMDKDNKLFGLDIVDQGFQTPIR